MFTCVSADTYIWGLRQKKDTALRQPRRRPFHSKQNGKAGQLTRLLWSTLFWSLWLKDYRRIKTQTSTEVAHRLSMCARNPRHTVLHRMKKHLKDGWRLWIWSYLNRAPVFLCPWLLGGDLCHTWEEWLCIAGTGHLRCRADAGHAMRSNPPVMWFGMGASYYLALIDLDAEVMWAIN